MMRRNKQWIRRAALPLLLSLAMLPGGGTVWAAEAENPSSSYAQDEERLNDNRLEYDELEGRIKGYYGPIKEAYAMVNSAFYDQADIAALMQRAASDLKDDADELEDSIKDGHVSGSALTGAMTELLTDKATSKAYRSGAQSMYQAIDRMTRDSSSTMKSLQRNVNQIVYSAQTAMNGCQQLEANLAVLSKSVETAESASRLQQAMEAQGMAVDSDILKAAANLASAKSQLSALQTQRDSIKKTLCLLTGYDSSALPELGAVPTADVASIASIDLNGDLEKAVSNNYSLISLRSGSSGTMDSIQQSMTKSTTQQRNKQQEVAYSEDTVRSTLRTLYDTILEKKADWDSAGTAYQSAALTWQAAQLQRQSGALSDIQYQQQELAWLQAQAEYQCADLALQQALQNYNWMVRGLTVSAD